MSPPVSLRHASPQHVLAHPLGTYSIVALDADSGELGVAIQSHYFSVGSMAPAAESGVGVAVMQSFPKIVFASTGMNLMREGSSAPHALQRFLENDQAPEYRQVALIDIEGRVAAHTGSCCVAEAGHRTGKHYACLANMMRNATVWDAMGEAYENTDGPLSKRMLAALHAAQNEGGDVRGCQSAAIMVVSGKPSGSSLQDRIIDLRVEDHPRPLEELDRLVALKRAYHHNSRGDAYLARKEFERALEEFAQAEALAPDTPELVFWRAVAMVNAGREEDALPLFANVFADNHSWAILAERLVDAALLPSDPQLLQRILSLTRADHGPR